MLREVEAELATGAPDGAMGRRIGDEQGDGDLLPLLLLLLLLLRASAAAIALWNGAVAERRGGVIAFGLLGTY